MELIICFGIANKINQYRNTDPICLLIFYSKPMLLIPISN